MNEKLVISRWFEEIIRNPVVIIYVFVRLYGRILIGRKARNQFLYKIGWGRFDGFAKSFLPSQIVMSLTVRQAISDVKRSYFRYEPYVSNLLEKTKGELFIDVGASHGYYSFLLHNNYQKIIAIEPHPQNVQIMKYVKQKCGFDKVCILKLAVSDCNGEEKLFIGKHSGGHSLVKYLIEGNNYILVKTKTLSSIVEKRTVDLVKVDVEGAEWNVLKGAEPIISQINSWLIEVHTLSRKREMEKLLQFYGYKTKWIDDNHIFCWRNKN